MMRQSFFDILDSWTLIFDRTTMEITLNEMSSYFYKRNVTFKLLEVLWDLLELMDDPLEFMTGERMSGLIEKELRDEEKEKVAKFIQIEVSGPPKPKIEVLNVEETISQFPDWFDEYDE